jgi:3-hydroxyisobutyrate dehydrogenase
MAGLGPAIHDFFLGRNAKNSWMPGPRPGMTREPEAAMSVPATIGLIGFGEVGSIFARELAAKGVGGVRAFDIAFGDAKSRAAKNLAAAGPAIAGAASHAEAAQGQPIVIAAVTAGSALAAAKAAAPHLDKGAFYLDVNSVSPGAKQEIGAAVEAAGGRFVEAAVMTSVPPKGLASPMLLGGRHTAAFMEAVAGLGMDLTPFSEKIGAASSVKMSRSVMIKGMEALCVECLLTARQYGVEKEVLASLTDTLVTDWRKTTRYMIGRALKHGRRRAEEVREVARTVEEAGLDPFMARATALRQDWAADQGLAVGDEAIAKAELEDLLDRVLAASGAARKAAAE